MQTRNFKLTFTDGLFTEMSLVVEIKETDEAIKIMRETVESWNHWEKVLEVNSGDYTRAFLHYVSVTVEAYKDDLNTIDHLVDLFSREEGFYPIGQTDWCKFIDFQNSYNLPHLEIAIKEL